MVISVRVTNHSPGPPSIRLALGVVTDQGHSLGIDIVYDQAASAQVMNTRITDAAKQALQDALGLTVTGQDTVRLLAGVT